MFRKLNNEANLTLLLHTKSPFIIQSTHKKILNPTQLDIQCLKSRYHGKDTVIIPGSSLKGVIRSRYEKIVYLLGGTCCDVFNHHTCCHKPKDWEKLPYEKQGSYIYQNMCPACQLFGSMDIASRIYFADAYPIETCILGERKGVEINRITGAPQKNALYDFEVVEEGRFQVKITLKNYELYQMALILYILKDINEGYVSFGSGTTKGNGRMEIENLNICLREYRKNIKGWAGAIDNKEILLDSEYSINYNWNLPFFGEMQLQNIEIDKLIKNFEKIDLKSKIRRSTHV